MWFSPADIHETIEGNRGETVRLVDDPWDWHYMKCPGCGEKIMLVQGSIIVNVESKGVINVPRMLEPFKGCRNPLCKWSAIGVDESE